jgi:NDP-sugar pyrophosphorylase family protein
VIERAVVLAAGRGTRMGEITARIPKPMLPVGGRPMLEHVLERLAAAGAREFLLVVGYRREIVERHFAHGPCRSPFACRTRWTAPAPRPALRANSPRGHRSC